MKARPPKEQIKPSNVFLCCGKEFVAEEIRAHLREVHNITELKGERKMMMHLDCADSYHSTFEWTIGGVTFSQHTSNPRHTNDPMRGPHD